MRPFQTPARSNRVSSGAFATKRIPGRKQTANRSALNYSSNSSGVQQSGFRANRGQQQPFYPGQEGQIPPDPRDARWPVRPFVYGANPPAPSNFILSIQSDLAVALGIPVPQSGVLGAGTRRAIKRFQSSVGLAASGRLNRPTIRALRGRPRAASVFDDSAPPVAVDSAPPVPPPVDADSPAPGPPDSDEPVADADATEEFEFRIKSPGVVVLGRGQAMKLDGSISFADLAAKLPDEPGIYVIKVNGTPWYVGHSATSVRTRFTHRSKALGDFKMSLQDLKGREITCYTLRSEQKFQVDYRSGSGPYFARPGMHGVVRAVEQHFIRSLKTANKGNIAKDFVTLSNGAWIKLRFAGVGTEPFERSIDPNLNFAKSDR